MTTVVAFHGQGTQRAGMGEELFAEFPELVGTAEDVLGYSVRELCATGGARLDDTRYAQPAIYLVNALAYRRYRLDGGAPPDVLLGHSLGEYNALEAAGVFGFEAGLRLVLERARLMSEVRGEMTAIQGLPLDTAMRVLAADQEQGVEISAINAPQQLVVGGPRVAPAVAALRAAGALGATALNVSGPFHTSHMSGAATEFRAFLHAHRDWLGTPRPTVLANHTARPYRADTLGTDLAGQIDHVLRWQGCVETVLELDPDPDFVEIGGRVLVSFVRQIRRHRARAMAEAGGAS